MVKKSNTKLVTSAAKATLLVTLIGALAPTFAKAEPRGFDWFSVMPGQHPQQAPQQQQQPATGQKQPTAPQVQRGIITKTQVKPPTAVLLTPEMRNITTAPQWFDQFDKLTDKYSPTAGDKVILQRPMLRQVERVNEWTAAAARVSKGYMTMSRTLKAMPIPPGMTDLKQFRDLTADWYHDSAGVFDDLIRPRPPAKTIEELQDQLNEIKNRSDNLSTTLVALDEMHDSLCKQYKANSPLHTDAFQKFVSGK
jgi:hypothetical protein